MSEHLDRAINQLRQAAIAARDLEQELQHGLASLMAERDAQRPPPPERELAKLLWQMGWPAAEWSLGGGLMGVRITFQSDIRQWYALVDRDVAWADSKTPVWRIGFYDEEDKNEDEGAQVLDLCRAEAPLLHVAQDIDRLLWRTVPDCKGQERE